MKEEHIEQAYELAKEQYAELGVDVDAALKQIGDVPISVHCWQGDDVTGFENVGSMTDGGIMATGNYPGKARTPDELRADLRKACSLAPGKHRANLHAIYAETNGAPVERNALTYEHFANWVEWAKQLGLGMDFNPSLFAHPKAESGYTLAHADRGIRKFWVEHCQACRKIGEGMGRELGSPCVTNVWIPDGSKDLPADRKGPRERLKESLDEVFAEDLDKACNLDAVESKLFGLGSESYVVGSHEFYMGYAAQNGILLCLDSGHFHPTEGIADKLSAVLTFVDEILLHVSRGVRWDSDHVTIQSDETSAIAAELVRGDFLGRTHVGLDYFDASINRVAAWVIGMRAMRRALLVAMLEPIDKLRALENDGDYTGRLALLEEARAMPWSAVWDYFCLREDKPRGVAWMEELRAYEEQVLATRR